MQGRTGHSELALFAQHCCRGGGKPAWVLGEAGVGSCACLRAFCPGRGLPAALCRPGTLPQGTPMASVQPRPLAAPSNDRSERLAFESEAGTALNDGGRPSRAGEVLVRPPAGSPGRQGEEMGCPE